VNGTNLAFVTIYGNQPEKLIAYIGSGKDIQATKKSVSFSSDAILGSISDPIVIDWLEERISVSPNPFQNELVIAIDAEESGDAKITINNMLNQVVYTGSFETQAGTTVLKIHPNITSGIYILRVEIAGKIVLQKIIKN
jgi:hypothetical protein